MLSVLLSQILILDRSPCDASEEGAQGIAAAVVGMF